MNESHKAWEGFDAAAMWVELDVLEASARAARAAKAAKQAEEAAAAAAAATLATCAKAEADAQEEARQEIEEVKQVVEESARVPSPDTPFEHSPFEKVPDALSSEGVDQAVERIGSASGGSRSSSFVGKKATLGRLTVQDSLALAGTRSLKRMPSVSRKDSLMAVGSGAVSVADIHHLEDEADIQVVNTSGGAHGTIHE